MDHIQKLAQLTGTDAADWEDAEGPDSRVGVDFYYCHKGGNTAWVNDDQGHVTFSVYDIEGDEVLSGAFGS
jgi:hypothetical protein